MTSTSVRDERRTAPPRPSWCVPLGLFTDDRPAGPACDTWNSHRRGRIRVFSSMTRRRCIRFPRRSMHLAGAVGLVRTMLGLVGLVPLRVPMRTVNRRTSCSAGSGRYRLLALVGSGGSGMLHLGHDGSLDRTVAVKLLCPGSDGEARARLRAEAHIAEGLSHPGIAR